MIKINENATYLRDDERKNIRQICLAVINAHGQNNSVGKFDKFIQSHVNKWANTGHDSDFYTAIITKDYEKEFGK